MIRYSDLSTAFSSVDFPVEEYVIDVDEKSIDTPYAAYICANSTPKNADGVNLFSFLTVRLLLIDDKLSFTNQAKIENVLNANNINYIKDYDYDEEIAIYTTSYQFEVLEWTTK